MMRPVLEHLLRHSTLTELFVTGMYGLPVSYLANCSNLTHPTLEDTEIFYDWDVLPSTFVLSKSLRLEEFSCAIRLPRSGPTNADQRRAATLLIEKSPCGAYLLDLSPLKELQSIQAGELEPHIFDAVRKRLSHHAKHLESLDIECTSCQYLLATNPSNDTYAVQ